MSPGDGGYLEPNEAPALGAWLWPAENELGVAVPTSIDVVRSSDMALAIRNVVAYSSGFAFELAMRIRPGSDRDADELLQQLHAREWLSRFEMEWSVDDALRLSVDYADGRRATSLDEAWGGDDPPPISLSTTGGKGSTYAYDQRFYAHPLPPPGPLTLAVDWRGAGVELTARTLDAAEILDAAPGSERFFTDVDF